jgi:DNA polymerase III alpha subunit
MTDELFTELNDRTLRFDGISVLDPEMVEHFLLRGMKPNQMRVLELTPELETFNENVPPDERLSTEIFEEPQFEVSWELPPKYLELDVEQHVLAVFGERLPELAYDATQTETAITRVARELEEYERRGLTDLLRTIIYTLDRFKETNQVFGVGRGSSCASFVLFLLGLHVVDSIKYDVPLEEFFHD